MNPFYIEFIEHGKKMAQDRGVCWDLTIDSTGNAAEGWNLTSLAGAVPPPTYYLRDFGFEKKVLSLLNEKLAKDGTILVRQNGALSSAWQDFIKAATVNQLFYRRNSPNHVSANILRPLRVLATSASEKEPWEVSVEDVKLAIKVGNRIQMSGKLGDLIKGVVKSLLDVEHITDSGPLFPALSCTRMKNQDSRARYTISKDELLSSLESRKSEQRLPERRAFWELVRIVFTKKPRTFVDEIRFIAIKVLLMTGLRAGEVVLIPQDWKRSRECFLPFRDPGKLNGNYVTSLMLRHFPEKQQEDNSDSTVLVEDTQYVPEMFSEILTEALDRAACLTEPLRRTLRRQTETGRIFPDYNKNDLVPIICLYPMLTGTAILLDQEKTPCDNYIERYSRDFSTSVLDELHRFQQSVLAKGSGNTLDMAAYQYFFRLRTKIRNASTRLQFCDSRGNNLPVSGRIFWGRVHLRIGEVEDYVRDETPTKLSDTDPVKHESGHLQTWEFMFLTPKRSLAEERNGALCDITRCISVGRPDPTLISLALGEFKSGNIFFRYGETAEDRQLSLHSHSLRHLQNTELYRLGVADTIITKRFNRRSVAQSYEYDHRSLAEELDQIGLPPDVELDLGDKTSLIAKIIRAGKATGPIVEGFLRIQKTEGEAAAFEYLKGEADGFHATPYGHCINSFRVNPCPKNLECFAGCRHLMATGLSDNRKYLLSLREKFTAALHVAESLSTASIGRENQIAHAKTRLDAINKVLATPEGEPVFPGGPDFSKEHRSVLDD
jgi:hypothetical protein